MLVSYSAVREPPISPCIEALPAIIFVVTVFLYFELSFTVCPFAADIRKKSLRDISEPEDLEVLYLYPPRAFKFILLNLLISLREIF